MIGENIKRLKEEIPEDVTLLAVSKTKPLCDLEEAYSFGIRDFGENKVQELTQKYEDFHKDVRWHLIGKLQSNKVKYIVDKVYLIHSLDSVKLLETIEKEFFKKNSVANLLIQINIGKEESKSGILEENLIELIYAVEKCNNVKVKGLMAIIPKGDHAANKKYFNKMKMIFDELKNQDYNNVEMSVLSMGMSNDYIEAIEEGSTIVRIGQGIFGKRDYRGN